MSTNVREKLAQPTRSPRLWEHEDPHTRLSQAPWAWQPWPGSLVGTYHHGNEGADVALLHDEVEHRHHGVHPDTSPVVLAPLLFKFFLLTLLILFLF